MTDKGLGDQEKQQLYERKIAALLWWPPHRVLLAKEQHEVEAKKVVAAALGQEPDALDSEGLLDWARSATEMALGLDAGFLLAGGATAPASGSLVFVHPLSGRRYDDLRTVLKDGLPKENETAAVSGGVTETASSSIENAVRQIAGEVQGAKPWNGDTAERVFLALWRNLAAKLRQGDATGLGRLWDLLPATAEVPLYSIWDHATAASAFAASLPNPAVLIFTLASVQEWVGQARRTQDSWMGSYLVSYLMWAAMRRIAEELGPDAIVAPGLREQPLVDRWLHSVKNVKPLDPAPQHALTIASFPNLFTAIVPNERAPELAQEAERALREEWNRISRCVKARVEGTVRSSSEMSGLDLNTPDPGGSPSVWETIWERQCGDFPDRLGIYWATCPLPAAQGSAQEDGIRNFVQEYARAMGWHVPGAKVPSLYRSVNSIVSRIRDSDVPWNPGMGYPLASDLVGRGLSARKQLRDFPQANEPEWKCTLCGLRRVLTPGYDSLRRWLDGGPSGEEALIRRFWEELAKIQRQSGRAGQAANFEQDERPLKLAGRLRLRGERLCAVCLVKRLALEAYFEQALGESGGRLSVDHHMFPSTASVATGAYLGRVLQAAGRDQRLRRALHAYVEQTDAFLDGHGLWKSTPVPKLGKEIADSENSDLAELSGIDGDWLYEESFDPAKLRRDYGLVDPDRDGLRAKAVSALKRLRAEADRLDLGAPPRYYAVLAMDGDKMGDWASGQLGPSVAGALAPAPPWADPKVFPLYPRGPALRSALSNVLRDFAVHVARVVLEELHYGKLVYAGGDDLLAFCPVSELFPVMRELRHLFGGCEPKPGFESNYPFRPHEGVAETPKRAWIAADSGTGDGAGAPGSGPGCGLTVSMGAAIVHESHPLQHAFAEAIAVMKKRGKEDLGRDAFGVRVLKRSGSALEAGSKFFLRTFSADAEGPVDVLHAVAGIADAMRSGKARTAAELSPRLAQEVAERVRGLSRVLAGLADPEHWREAQRSELRRLVSRHSATSSSEDLIQTLDRLLQGLQHADLGRTPVAPASRGDGWKVLADLLLLARFLAGEG